MDKFPNSARLNQQNLLGHPHNGPTQNFVTFGLNVIGQSTAGGAPSPPIAHHHKRNSSKTLGADPQEVDFSR